MTLRSHDEQLRSHLPDLILICMTDVTQILNAIAGGDSQAGGQLLPVVYDELRRLAAQKLAHEKPGQTLDATGLVHEAYLRLVGDQQFANRRHFFAAAAEAMRRILIENARRKRRERHGGGRQREQTDLEAVVAPDCDAELLALHDALEQFALHDPLKAKLVELRFFGGLTLAQAAECLNISLSTADRAWRYSRAWLYTEMADDKAGES